MRIYYCSDIHASEKCWKKTLATPSFYDADVVIVGGDITGKFIVPIVEQKPGLYVCSYMGVKRRVKDRASLSRLEAMIADSGSYGKIMTPDEQAEYEGDQPKIDELFKGLIRERVYRWIEMAEDRFKGTGRRLLVSGANDDFFEVDAALAESELIEDPNGKVIQLGSNLAIMGMGYGNITPWHCPRDITEEELARRIDAVADALPDPGQTIFSLHVPPYGTGLDVAPRLDEDLRMVLGATGPEKVSVGSTAVRDAITKYRPLVGLHGHIHEAKGIKQLEGVTVANPGSEYGEGILDGLLLDYDERKGITHIELVVG